jgi:hypothetical protein
MNNYLSNFKYKLGKLQPRLDNRTLKYKSYFGKLPPLPKAIDWSGNIKGWRMLANDQYGDCTCATAMHLEMLWTSQTVNEDFEATDEATLAAYSAITGFNEQDPNTDNGAVVLNVLNYWRKVGFVPGKPILGYVMIDNRKIEHIKSAIALFGGAYVGIRVPDDAMDTFSRGKPWTNTRNRNIEGGHAIPLVGYDKNYFTCVTWGQEQLISYDWLNTYLEESYAVLSPNWLDAHNMSPSGFDLVQLQKDLNLIG